MSATIAVVICNWNKKEDVLNCIDSVLHSKSVLFDIFVVDNASNDGSVVSIQEKYGDQVNLICNDANLGGSGGFNSGLQEVLKRNYTYVHLLDNDVILHEKALQESLKYLEEYKDIGAVGSKLLIMNKANQIQELGADIDWNNFYIKPHFKGDTDGEHIPEVVECDYVPACSVMVRVEAIREVGLMDERCFIYWDDIEWFYRIKQAGYKVVALSKSKIWHKMGAGGTTNTFATYYFWRNRINFFAKYIKRDEVSKFAHTVHFELFRAIFLSQYKGQYSSAKTLLFALDDALHSIRGRSKDGRIFEREQSVNTLEQLLFSEFQIIIFDCPKLGLMKSIINNAIKLKPSLKLLILAKFHTREILECQFPNVEVITSEEIVHYNKIKKIQIVDSILDIEDYYPNHVDIFVDQYFNQVSSDKVSDLILKFKASLLISEQVYLPFINTKLIELNEVNRETLNR